MNQGQNNNNQIELEESSKLTALELGSLIKELGIHDQNGISGIGTNLEKRYLKEYQKQEEIRAMLSSQGAENPRDFEILGANPHRKNKTVSQRQWKYNVGPFSFN